MRCINQDRQRARSVKSLRQEAPADLTCYLILLPQFASVRRWHIVLLTPCPQNQGARIGMYLLTLAKVTIPVDRVAFFESENHSSRQAFKNHGSITSDVHCSGSIADFALDRGNRYGPAFDQTA